MNKKAYLALSLLLLLAMSCGKKQRTGVDLRLTARERTRIDTIYTQRLDSMRPFWDSLCDLRYQSLVDAALDSIIEERLEEEARLRARLPQ